MLLWDSYGNKSFKICSSLVQFNLTLLKLNFKKNEFKSHLSAGGIKFGSLNTLHIKNALATPEFIHSTQIQPIEKCPLSAKSLEKDQFGVKI